MCWEESSDDSSMGDEPGSSSLPLSWVELVLGKRLEEAGQKNFKTCCFKPKRLPALSALPCWQSSPSSCQIWATHLPEVAILQGANLDMNWWLQRLVCLPDTQLSKASLLASFKDCAKTFSTIFLALSTCVWGALVRPGTGRGQGGLVPISPVHWGIGHPLPYAACHLPNGYW